MKRISLALLASFLVLAVSACGGGEQTEQPNNNQPSAEQPSQNAPSADAGGFDAETAEATYQQRCIGCHGQNLEGVSGPALKDVGARYTQEEILAILNNGKGAMPGGLVSGEEASNLAAWLAAKK
ncbi:cytochrome c551 [Brevibacillus marinus]|uniref:cytochrome c551 n=1 Tax=Brevibacillus marinus TaxID=2496837 RepID=UPI000F81C905|nr:cytochrome c [Brevibacillus marinus]